MKILELLIRRGKPDNRKGDNAEEGGEGGLTNHEDGIEGLVIKDFYDAEFVGLSGTKYLSPIVTIPDTINRVPYYGLVIPSTHPNQRTRDFFDSIRQQLINDGSNVGTIKVLVISGPKGENKLYNVVATEYSMSPEDGLSVVVGNDVFNGRYIFTTNRNKPALRVYSPDKKAGFGYLEATKDFFPFSESFLDNEEAMTNYIKICNRKFAEKIITSEKISKLKAGDHVLVRKVGESSQSSTLFFEPVVNFREDDEVRAPSGEELVTRVINPNGKDLASSGLTYDAGTIIYNLPILWPEKDKNSDSMLGVGYVKRPLDEKVNFYYKPVYVVGADMDVGKYVNAKIMKNGSGIILARKLT